MSQQPTTVRPPALRPGDRVAVLTVSSPVDPDKLESGLRTLRELGLEPDVLGSARAEGDYLAGDDKLRAADLVTALTDPGYAAVLLANGGYGAHRTLELVDWDAIGTPSPRVVVGYSDVTALHEAVTARLGWVSLFGPMVAVTHYERGRYGLDTLARLLTDPASVRELRFPDGRVLVPGTAEGVTRGGTLALLAGSIGTPTSVPARGGLLLLEDVDEKPYRLDGFLTHLRRSGYLDGVAGVICGTFTNCGPPEQIEDLLRDRLAGLGVPVLTGADIGHGVQMQTFPLGVRARLDTAARTLTLDEPALA